MAHIVREEIRATFSCSCSNAFAALGRLSSRVSARSLDPNWEAIERWFVRELALLPDVVAAVALDREDAEIQVINPGAALPPPVDH